MAFIMNCGEDPARGLWTEEYLIEIAFSSKSQKMGGGESLQTLYFLSLWFLPCEAEWFEGGGVRERYSCGCVQKGDPGPDSDYRVSRLHGKTRRRIKALLWPA